MKPVTDSEKRTSKTIGLVEVGSACVEPLLIVTVGGASGAPWTVPVPESVNVLPAIGRNTQS